jgi:hypothetical protein
MLRSPNGLTEEDRGDIEASVDTVASADTLANTTDTTEDEEAKEAEADMTTEDGLISRSRDIVIM